MLIDTHCHIHDQDYPLSPEQVFEKSAQAGVEKMIVVGTDVKNSELAVQFAKKYDNVFVAVGVHPHEAKFGAVGLEELLRQNNSKIVAVGEIGLDYFYPHSDRSDQIKALENQLQLAQDYNLPVSFHVREAFDDFWPVLANFKNIRGVLHSFTDSVANMEIGLGRGFYFGVNGISTFTKDAAQKQMFSQIPLERMVFETDAPYLTPSPFRGKVNLPAMVGEIAKYHAKIRQIDLSELEQITTQNAINLFNI